MDKVRLATLENACKLGLALGTCPFTLWFYVEICIKLKMGVRLHNKSKSIGTNHHCKQPQVHKSTLKCNNKLSHRWNYNHHQICNHSQRLWERVKTKKIPRGTIENLVVLGMLGTTHGNSKTDWTMQTKQGNVSGGCHGIRVSTELPGRCATLRCLTHGLWGLLR